MGKDYIYAVTPLVVDALMDRDLVHRQTACTVVKHVALGCYGMSFLTMTDMACLSFLVRWSQWRIHFLWTTSLLFCSFS